MIDTKYLGGRVSPATFALRFLPLAEFDLDSENIGAPLGSTRYCLKSGIELAVYRSGVLVFDCQKWPPGESVELPKTLVEGGKKLPVSFTEADNKAVENVVNRVRMANCFLACMSHAISRVQSTAFGLGQEIDPSNYLPVVLTRHPFDLNASEIEVVFQGGGRQLPPGSSGIKVKTETVRLACQTLDNVLASVEVTQVIDLYYKACYRYSLHDFALSATIAWTVCEKAINLLWKRHLESIRSDTTAPQRITGERFKKLTGRDFTASIVSETLELLEIIDRDLYLELNSARQVRNSWMHSLNDVKDREASQALTTAYKMINTAYRINLQVQLSRGMSY